MSLFQRWLIDSTLNFFRVELARTLLLSGFCCCFGFVFTYNFSMPVKLWHGFQVREIERERESSVGEKGP